MKLIPILLVLVVSLVTSTAVHAEDDLNRREWKVDGVVREALVHVSATKNKNGAPIVFAFHGHGGSMKNAAQMFGYHKLWPEAIVVYMQGLNTPGRLTDPEGKKPGWQHSVGAQNDRDLKFFDAVLASLKKDYKVDTKRIYSTGHSNGGGFTYLLWEARGKEFAAFAPSASLSISLVRPEADGTVTNLDKSKNLNSHIFVPKPVLHVAGENDPLVKFTWQKMMIDALRKIEQCGDGKPWDADKRCTLYRSKLGGDVLTYIHSGTHKFPEEAPAIIVKFFKEYPKAKK